MKKAVAPVILIAVVWAAFIYLRRSMFPDDKEKSAKNRSGLRSRLNRKQGVPIRCRKHATLLQIGELAVVDDKRCDLCPKPPTPGITKKVA